MSRTTPRPTTEMVPLADRLRFLQLFRVAVAVVAVAFGLLSRDALEVPVVKLVSGTGAFLLLSLAAELFWRFPRRRGLPLFGAMLIVDGLYLAGMSYATGGAVSPLRHLLLVHLIAVALLASYRTAMKIALWHSLLLIVTFHAQQAGVLAPVREAVNVLPGTPFRQLCAFVVALWLATLVTSTLSAVNERELRRRRFDLEALARMAGELELARGQGAVAGVAAVHVADAFAAPRVAVLAVDGGRLTVLASVGTAERGGGAHAGSDGNAGGGAREAAGNGGAAAGKGGHGNGAGGAGELAYGPGSLVNRTIQGTAAVLASRLDAAADPGLAALMPDATNLVAVPLSAEGSPVGVLVVEYAGGAGRRIERRAVSTLERFASQIGLALRNAALLEEVRRLAATDGLTGLANRRTFDAILEREVARAARNREDLSLVLLDIDRFKAVNDAYGHQTGDEVIRRVAATVALECREYDTAARYGGEEIALVLPACGPSAAVAITERVRTAVAAADLPVAVTVSAGTATFPLDATTVTELVKATDAALYASKRAGRDRVTAAGAAGAAAATSGVGHGGDGGGGGGGVDAPGDGGEAAGVALGSRDRD